MSLSLDFSGVMSQAGTIINSLFPVFVIPVGLALGIGLLSKIIAEIRKAF